MFKSRRIKRMIYTFALLVALLIVIGIAALLVLKSQINRYEKHWDSVASVAHDADALTYVALGDSTAQGIGATSAERGYVGLLAKSLEEKHQRPVRIINLSKSGARLEDCINDQLPALGNITPDFITIEIGANDMKDFDPDKFESEMRTVLSALPNSAVVSDIPYFGGGRFSHLENNVKNANIIMTRLANEKNRSLAPLHRITKDRDSLLTYAIDFFHPSNVGYKNWHDAFWIELSQI